MQGVLLLKHRVHNPELPGQLHSVDERVVTPGFFHDDRKLSPYSVFGLMLIYTLSAAACYTMIKAGLEYAPPLQFAGLRTLIGGFSLIVLLLVLQKPVFPHRDLLKWILPVGLVSTTITFGFMFSSPEYTSAGIASVLGNAQPLAIIALAALFLGEKISPLKIAALFLGLSGVILISANALMDENQHGFVGIMLATATSAGAAVTAVLLKKIKPGRDLISLTGWQLVAGSLPLFLGSQFIEAGRLVSWEGTFVGLVAFLGVIGTGLTTIIWFWLLQKYNAGSLSLYLFLIPVFGLLIAFIVFNESLQLFEIIGITLAIIAIGLAVANEYKGRINESQSNIKTQSMNHDG